MRRIAAFCLAGGMIGSAALHVYWGLGGTWFLETALDMRLEEVPESVFWLIWPFVAAMLSAAFLALGSVGIVARSWPQRIFEVGLLLFSIFMMAGAADNFSVPRFWDRWVFGPVFLIFAVLGLLLVFQKKAPVEYQRPVQ